MITGDYAYLKDIAKNYICSEHLTPVEVAWHAQENSYVLHCGEGHYPEEVTRQLSLTEEYRAGEELPGHIEDKVKKQMRRRAMTQGKEPTAVTFAGVPATDLGTGELLDLAVVKAMVKYARDYGLDAARGHVVMMYSKPYITIDGYLYHAKKTGIPYTLASRPLGNDELKAYQVPEGAHAWLATARMSTTEAEFTGLGIVTREEMTAKSSRDQSKLRSPVVAAHPWQLAQKRAEWQALRRAFPIGESEEIKKGDSNNV